MVKLRAVAHGRLCFFKDLYAVFGLHALGIRVYGLGLCASGHERLCFRHERLCFLFWDSMRQDMRVYVTGIRASWHERLCF